MSHNFQLSLIAGAVLALASSGAQAVDISEHVKLNGFGTAGVAHATADGHDFTGSFEQPTGTPKTHEWAFGTDSKLGGQVEASYGQVSAVVQATMQQRYDASWHPVVDWANLKYRVTDALAVRVGRMGTPAYIVSDYRKVGYSYVWLRPPIDAYYSNPLQSYDGADATYRMNFSGNTLTLQGFAGQSKLRIPSAVLEADNLFGGNISFERDALTLRAAYIHTKLSAKDSDADVVFDGYRALAKTLGAAGLHTQAAQASAAVDQYEANRSNASFGAVGVVYDPGTWMVMSEATRINSDSYIPDSTSWYVTGAYRWDKFTPYATFSRHYINSASTAAGVSKTGIAPIDGYITALNGGLNTVLGTQNSAQMTQSVGVRWDFYKNMDLKMQFDHVKHDTGSYGTLVTNAPADVSSYNVFAAAIDFVF